MVAELFDAGEVENANDNGAAIRKRRAARNLEDYPEEERELKIIGEIQRLLGHLSSERRSAVLAYLLGWYARTQGVKTVMVPGVSFHLAKISNPPELVSGQAQQEALR